MQGIITQHESLVANWKSAAALLITLGLAIFVAMRLFRWEKDEKLKGSAKLWVAGVMVPFLALGVYQFRTNEQTVKNRMLWRAAAARRHVPDSRTRASSSATAA